MDSDDSVFWGVSDSVYNAIRTAELAAEGAALRASARAALLHWAALALLGASLLLSIAMLLLPILRPWSGQAIWVLILGLAAYLAVVAIVYWTRPRPSAPELRKVRRIRHGIAALLVERQTLRGARQDPVLIRALSDAIHHLDEQVIPALQQLVERRSQLQRELRRYERQELHAPAPEVLERLRRILARLEAAIKECVQQAANAYAMLVALLQEGDDENVAARARTWADDLTRLYDTLAEVLRGTEDSRHAEDEPPPPASPDAPAGTPEDEPVAEGDSAVQSDASDDALVRLVEEALKRMRDPAALGRCELIERLPLTMEKACEERRNGHVGVPTSLERAQALRDVLVAAVDRLRPVDAIPGRGTGASLRHDVLHGLYVEGRPTRQIWRQLDMSESTLHRHRREGIGVLTRELHEQEARLRRGGPEVFSD